MQRRAPKTRKEKQFSQKITIASRDKLPSGNPEELKRRKGTAKTTPMGVDKKIIRRKVKRREGIKEKKNVHLVTKTTSTARHSGEQGYSLHHAPVAISAALGVA